MLVNMKKILEIAEAEGYAIPCINTPNEETVRAVIGAAEELNTPIIIDHAQVHDSLIPIERIGPIMLKYAKEARVPVCVHLDHGSDYEFVMRAVKVGFPSIMYDCSALPFEENVEKVAQFVKFAHAAGITVEAELGIMASTDEDTHDDDPEKRVLTNEDIREFFTEPAEAKEFAEKYPGHAVKNISQVIAELRMQKDGDEVALVREAIGITDKALQYVMKHLEPGMAEYQAQADFEYMIRYNGAEGTAFPTIAGSGANGTMLHYDTNLDICEDGSLLLMDLGAKYRGYCADITRTYPVNGTYTERQRQVYDIVLAANREVAKTAKPGMTLKELNEIAKKVLAAGCMKLGLIEKEDEIDTYYMHGVSHHLGIDVHDVTAACNDTLQPGAIITDEPGLYIDEWEIGIRIEDDLLITENGCECLSEAIIRDPDEIEAFMKDR